MVSVSAAFRQALAVGAPQRIALAFDGGTIISNEDIDVENGVDFREVFCSETDLTIGLALSSEVSFALFNEDRRYANFAFGAFNAYIGVRISSTKNGSAPTRRPAISRSGRSLTVSGNGVLETYELCPMGRYIAPRPSVVRKNVIDVQANDQMTLFDAEMPDSGELGIAYPTTTGKLFVKLCEQAGVRAASYTFLNDDIKIETLPDSFTGATMREVLAWIAQAAGANARFNREGLLEFTWLNPVYRVFDEGDYVDFEPTRYSAAQVDRLHVRNEDSTEETVFGSGDNTYVLQNNPFLKQEDLRQGFSVIVTPVCQSVYEGGTVTFYASILGCENPKIIWQASWDGETWFNYGHTSGSLVVSGDEYSCSMYYRVEVTNEDNRKIYSNGVKAILKQELKYDPVLRKKGIYKKKADEMLARIREDFDPESEDEDEDDETPEEDGGVT